MQELGIGAVLALGTKALSEVETVSIDILDMEQVFLMQHFDACFAFLHRQEQRHVQTLVHCVYGQSRSAAICVAFLMHSEQLSLQQSYDRVQAARPCIYINSGFLAICTWGWLTTLYESHLKGLKRVQLCLCSRCTLGTYCQPAILLSSARVETR
ncbi:hypothetical protein DYB38_007405 [Aphanomyces astaci]|uniref:Protein-tyrosine-phosphatase n=1 Tax=Aphanomyces astaci TaxID=112090 RepID=A0A397C5W9_APHAT|nr:hypothetical protein DYB38_007405 [Aphanomyces astaci]RHY64793.1 hypothetical protein DYB34_007843 [Aphanomyces astaci]